MRSLAYQVEPLLRAVGMVTRHTICDAGNAVGG